MLEKVLIIALKNIYSKNDNYKKFFKNVFGLKYDNIIYKILFVCKNGR